MKALILLGHGSKVPGFDEVMGFHKKRVEEMGIFDQIEIAYASTEPGIQEVVEKVSSDEVYIVPLFMAYGSHLEELPSLLGLKGSKGNYKGKNVYICDFIGKSELVTHAIINSVVYEMESQK